MPKQPDWTLAIAAKVRRRQLRHHRKAGEVLRELLLDGLRHAVLSTTKLLELILVHLPNADIDQMRRVCRNWNATILSSPAIQSKLFLRIREPLDRFWSITSCSPLLGWQPVEDFKRVPVSASVQTYQARLLTSRASTNKTYGSRWVVLRPVQLNPLFSPVLASRWNFAAGFAQDVFLKLDSVTTMLSGQWTTPRMLDSFITDPPCYHATIDCQWRGECTLPNKAGRKRVWCFLLNTVHRTTGLTVRDIIRAFFQESRTRVSGYPRPAPANLSWSFSKLVVPLRRQGYEDDKEFCLRSYKLTLMGVVVPTEEQWRTVQ